ncbi:MAG TPA: protein-L-isoaspartate(D-aspartate) O-methyltransferase [Gammaproteobacteria bacterium]|nr:protein-L-isoaspartate(D-aspartate) O-methyltransferase [Gammaproteobacteria bacterium]
MSLEKERQRMIRDIEREVEYTRHMIGRDRFQPRVMDAMREVPREEFVPPELRHAAFDNGPLPIGHGQTISQPYIVALMTDLLELQPGCKVLEIGTGSGYQTAILAQLCDRVYTVEVVPALSEEANKIFQRLGYDNIEARVGDGYQGWPEHAPYDGIIVTAAASYIPPALVEQLKAGGRLVIPVGQPYGHQELLLVEKDRQGEVHTRNILGVAFVPMIEKGGGEDA